MFQPRNLSIKFYEIYVQCTQYRIDKRLDLGLRPIQRMKTHIERNWILISDRNNFEHALCGSHFQSGVNKIELCTAGIVFNVLKYNFQACY